MLSICSPLCSPLFTPVWTPAETLITRSLPIILYYLLFIPGLLILYFYLSFLIQRKKTYYAFFMRKLSASFVQALCVEWLSLLRFLPFLLILALHSRAIWTPVWAPDHHLLPPPLLIILCYLPFIRGLLFILFYLSFINQRKKTSDTSLVHVMAITTVTQKWVMISEMSHHSLPIYALHYALHYAHKDAHQYAHLSHTYCA